MGKEYRAKVFKSGNSLALRLPKALGLEEGAEMVVRALSRWKSRAARSTSAALPGRRRG